MAKKSPKNSSIKSNRTASAASAMVKKSPKSSAIKEPKAKSSKSTLAKKSPKRSSIKEPSKKYIHLKGAREHNLKNLELKIPRECFVAITGPSGSGKSSLLFDTLYAEGYRKYVESLGSKAKSALQQVRRANLDFLEGLPPLIAIEQRKAASNNPRSTVASVTEVAEFARLIWANLSEQFDPIDGAPIVQRSLEQCAETLLQHPEGSRLTLLAPIFEAAEPIALKKAAEALAQKGFQRARIGGKLVELTNTIAKSSKKQSFELVIDRLTLKPNALDRLKDSLELAFAQGGEKAIGLIETPDGKTHTQALSRALAGAKSGKIYEPLSLRHFNWNYPEAACPSCEGIGHTRQFTAQLVVPDPELSIAEGALKAWRLGGRATLIRRNSILRQLALQVPFDLKTPWKKLPAETRELLLEGSKTRIFQLRAWRRKPMPMHFEGILKGLEQSARKIKSEPLQARLARYQIQKTCPECEGSRLNPRVRKALIEKTSFDTFLAQDVEAAWHFVRKHLHKSHYKKLEEAVEGLQSRLEFLMEIGLGYLELDRPYRTLSGGEAQRVRLGTQLGSGLIGIAYALDEPSIGLHPKDNQKLIQSLQKLRDKGNSVIVVEHDIATLEAAEHLIELGPGSGKMGGSLIFQGTPKACAKAKNSITGPHLFKKPTRSAKSKQSRTANTIAAKARSANTIAAKSENTTQPIGWLEIKGAHHHNLKKLNVKIPCGVLSAVCGVSGSGKSTLINEVLGLAALRKLNGVKCIPGAHKATLGLEQFDACVRITQEPIGKSPRSNPATYTKMFDPLRKLFAECTLSKMRGYKPGRFSFNVSGGRCEHCKGDGVIRMDMQFLSDTYITCPSCQGSRYNRETLQVHYKGRSITDILKLNVAEALACFEKHPAIANKLHVLKAVGLDYLQLGQAANTLSGGEAQRIKLACELAKRQHGRKLYILDEPTTGLHVNEIEKLLELLRELRDKGNSVIIIEHHPNVIAAADWILELGPEGGHRGGEVLFSGTLEGLKQNKKSRIAPYL